MKYTKYIVVLMFVLPSFALASNGVSCDRGDLFDIATGKQCLVQNVSVASLQAEIVQLKARVSVLEAKLGIPFTGGVEMPTFSPTPTPVPSIGAVSA